MDHVTFPASDSRSNDDWTRLALGHPNNISAHCNRHFSLIFDLVAFRTHEGQQHETPRCLRHRGIRLLETAA